MTNVVRLWDKPVEATFRETVKGSAERYTLQRKGFNEKSLRPMHFFTYSEYNSDWSKLCSTPMNVWDALHNTKFRHLTTSASSCLDEMDEEHRNF